MKLEIVVNLILFFSSSETQQNQSNINNKTFANRNQLSTPYQIKPSSHNLDKQDPNFRGVRKMLNSNDEAYHQETKRFETSNDVITIKSIYLFTFFMFCLKIFRDIHTVTITMNQKSKIHLIMTTIIKIRGNFSAIFVVASK